MWEACVCKLSKAIANWIISGGLFIKPCSKVSSYLFYFVVTSCLRSLAVLENVEFFFSGSKSRQNVYIVSLNPSSVATTFYLITAIPDLRPFNDGSCHSENTLLPLNFHLAYSRQRCDGSHGEKKHSSKSTKMFSIPFAIYYCDVGVNHCAWVTHLIGACETWCFHEAVVNVDVLSKMKT